MNKLNFAIIETIFLKFHGCVALFCCQHFKKFESCLRQKFWFWITSIHCVHIPISNTYSQLIGCLVRDSTSCGFWSKPHTVSEFTVKNKVPTLIGLCITIPGHWVVSAPLE